MMNQLQCASPAGATGVSRRTYSKSARTDVRGYGSNDATPLTRARAYAARVPGATQGQGGDRHTFALACKLKELGSTDCETLHVLREWNRTCQPPWSERELIRKTECAYGRRVQTAAPASTAPACKKTNASITADFARIEQIAAENKVTRAALEQMNPCSFDSTEPHTERIIDWLFPGNPLLCCGWSKFKFDCRRREEWRGELANMEFIATSAPDQPEGLTQEGKPSKHAKSMFGRRHYLVYEADQLSHDLQAAVLFHLSHYLPLVMVVDSAGKSLHGWFDVRTVPAVDALKFFRYARLLGADHAAWNIEAFKRMPDGTRENGKRQQVIFLNPKGAMPKGVAI